MQPGSNGGVVNPMKAFKGYVASDGYNNVAIFGEFATSQQQLLQLLHTASMRNLNKIRIPVSIAPLIKMKLGDTFRFLVAHQQRHLVQIEHTIQQLTLTSQPTELGLQRYAVR